MALFSGLCMGEWWILGSNRQAYILLNNRTPPLAAVGGGVGVGKGSRSLKLMNSLRLFSGRGGAASSSSC